MDIIYHRNCLDGVFSAYLFYLTCKVINEKHLVTFKQLLAEKLQTKIINLQSNLVNDNLTDLTAQTLQSQLKMQVQIDKTIVNENLFHSPGVGVNYSAYSFNAGQFFPIKFSSKNKILFILDMGPGSYENLIKIIDNYDYIIIIDHHTSFRSTKDDIIINKQKIQKIFYVFNEQNCAAQLCLFFLNKYFNFQHHFQENFICDLNQIIAYVGANDLKKNQSKLSKQFVLGFYYFDIQLSHLNPMLNKRLGMINLQYLMEKGKPLYIKHLEAIANQLTDASIGQLKINGNLQNIKFYMVRPANPQKISDIGVVLSYLSKKHEMENLAVLYMPRPDEIRISTRSFRGQQNPLALKMAQKFQGGGHVCAAGFKINKNKFNSLFVRTPADKKKLILKSEEVEYILFKNSY